ncbi:hypothetical protein EYB53_010640 [Candidatus Chloroploca sp. M-50]|uniref:DUF2357 domain-containing protein n=1 Tax=Candidatus Chloroploca mongolica TaxID=2528176 RepID=A0ABS4D9Q6_9CHLR|nr:hypothetical protein [Candidatus Chloroploca mongolica]MBP1466162.1 hypothetical protein [Candidatus Chloroploca mongolica]
MSDEARAEMAHAASFTIHPSSVEREAFLWLQGRMVELLLRHDVRRLGSSFAPRLGSLFDDEHYTVLHPYRELAVLIYLRDELLASILPRIKRRLSFLAPREGLIEELPPRGRIDWAHTLAAGLRDRPGEPPLHVHTRQRRRHFATPENLLTVVTLLEYRAAIQVRLDAEREVAGAMALRHPLHEMLEQVTRELAFPQFVGLVREAEAIANGDAEQRPIDLERAVEAHLVPGHNSAYDDLLAWRRNLRGLRLLERNLSANAPPMLGADPARDNYLYQIWLFYELAELLERRGVREIWHVGTMRLRFHWGEGDDRRVYWLQHDRAIPHHWHQAPGVRPDLYLERDGRAEVRQQGSLIWREPGYVLDAKYYKPRDSVRAPSGTIKRMIADLQLTGERRGALLFAFQSAERPADLEDSDLLEQLSATAAVGPLYRVWPEPAAAQSTRPDAAITIWRACPQIGGLAATHATLVAVLDEAHQALRAQVPVACHGVFLDPLSLSERGAMLGRDGTAFAPEDLLVCPKPHIGPWRVDLVSRSHHCCRDEQLCHIIGQVGATPPVRPPRTAHELLSELDRLFAVGALETLDETAIEYAVSRIEGLTRRFAEITGALHDLGRYEAKLGDIGLDRTLPLIGPTERASLALAIYLRDQLDDVQANDYSASIIHVARVLERELQRRLLSIPGITGADFPYGKPTLGALGGVYRKHPALWARIAAHLAQVWVGQVDPEDTAFVVNIAQLIPEIDILVRARNQAAHTTPIARNRFRELLRTLCAGGPLRVGALNVLLLAWPLPVVEAG